MNIRLVTESNSKDLSAVKRPLSARHAGRALTMLMAVWLTSSLAHAGPEDPDRNSTEKVNSDWVTGMSGTALEAKRAAGERIVDLNIEGSAPWRFTAATVANTGTYQRTDAFFYDKTGPEVTEKLRATNSRIVAVDAVYVSGQPRFAVSTVRNEGTAAKEWRWNYDLTGEQVTKDINDFKIRLISLKSYDTPLGRRFVYAGIKNEGTDSRAWWWYPSETPEAVGRLLGENKARLVSIDRTSAGRWAVIMVQDPSSRYSWWAHDNPLERTQEISATHGVRIAALDSYVADGKRYYTFAGIDNTNAETARLRGYLDQAYDDPAFGGNVIRGVYVKQVAGPVIADLGASLRFQPLSMLKLLPYLYAWDMIDKGRPDPATSLTTTLGTRISWIEDPSNSNTSCLTAGAAGTRKNSAALRDLLPTMMWLSHNRSLDAVLDHYGPDVITDRGRRLGLLDTEIHYGCAQPGNPVPWADNRTTLRDIGKLYEDVHQGVSLTKQSSRDGFFSHMIELDYDGAQYTSPYTGETVGPLFNGFWRDIVKREAGAAKQGQVEEFLKRVRLHGKGGGGGPSSTEFGYTDSLFVELPVWKNGSITSSFYVATWYMYKLSAPPGCPDEHPNDGGACEALWEPEHDMRDTFTQEMLAAPIRAALATWPASP